MSPLLIWRPRKAGKRARQPGQAVFEFVLMLPLFVLFLLLLAEFGVLMYEHISVANAVREGARYGAVLCAGDLIVDGGFSCTEDLIKARTAVRSGGMLTDASVAVTWVARDGLPDGLAAIRGDSVVVTVNRPHAFFLFPGATITVASCADMRLEENDTVMKPDAVTGCGS